METSINYCNINDFDTSNIDAFQWDSVFQILVSLGMAVVYGGIRDFGVSRFDPYQ
jgi:hypothetical protein